MNPKKLIKSVKALTGWRETAFILALAERALPNIILFLESVERSEVDSNAFPKGLSSLMETSWESAVFHPKEEAIIACLDEVVAHIIEEELDSFGILPCNNGLELWEMALVSALNRDKKRAEEASQVSIATVSEFLEFTEGDGLDENALIRLFEKHELMVRELSFQQALCDLLRGSDKLSKDLLRNLRALARDDGWSNLGISLDD
ncbi:hypothetical protein A3758_18030 [Oleiphilus sp. HI0118]|nr:hypothetical protein A3758_18030 [Oleiphilus sp. HI0118]